MTPAPTPPEPVGDWPAYSAAQHARLHPERPADPTPDELQRYAALRGVFIAEAQAEVVTLKADLAACRQLNVDLQRDTLRVFNELRAERDFLRESLSLLPARVQLEILNAVQEAEPLCNEHSLLNHAALLVLLARMSAMQARAAQAGRSAV